MIGSLNPCPFRVGGGTTPAAKGYSVLRGAVGTGGSARDDRGLDGLWRRSRAKGMASASSSTRRALIQGWAHLATDLLPSYERALGLAAPFDASEAERRRLVVAALTARLSATVQGIEDALSAIDARFSVLTQYPADATTTIPGRVFEAHDAADEGPAFGGGVTCSTFAHYSTSDVVYVLLDTGDPGAPSPSDAVAIAEGRRLLRRLIPSWKSAAVLTSVGFEVGVSPLGLTGLE